MSTQFNTNRGYSEHGQRIVIQVVEEGILFKDLDRHINGLCPCFVSFPVTDDLQGFFMVLYDHCAYIHDARANDLKYE